MTGVRPGELIAHGRTADVHAWEPGKVLKLFHTWVDREVVVFEQRIARNVHAAGVIAPAVGEIVSHEARLGLVYERLEAATLFEVLLKRLWRTKTLARKMADLHLRMHACQAPGLPSLRDRLRAKIRAARPLPESLRERALSALGELPEGTAVCHGDFHPGNVLVTERGLVAIDWTDASAGHPLGDIARSQLLMVNSEPPGNLISAALANLIRRTFYSAYSDRYFAQSHHDAAEVEAWLPVVAAARLAEGIDSEQARLLRMARHGLGDSPKGAV